MNNHEDVEITSTVTADICLLIYGKRRISSYPTRWFTFVILSHVLRTTTLEYGHKHRIYPYMGVYSSWWVHLGVCLHSFTVYKKKTIHYEDRLWPKTSEYSPYTSMVKTIVILSHVLRTSMTVYGVFRPAARPVTDVYGHRNASPGQQSPLSIVFHTNKFIVYDSRV